MPISPSGPSTNASEAPAPGDSQGAGPRTRKARVEPDRRHQLLTAILAAAVLCLGYWTVQLRHALAEAREQMALEQVGQEQMAPEPTQPASAGPGQQTANILRDDDSSVLLLVPVQADEPRMVEILDGDGRSLWLSQVDSRPGSQDGAEIDLVAHPIRLPQLSIDSPPYRLRHWPPGQPNEAVERTLKLP